MNVVNFNIYHGRQMYYIIWLTSDSTCFVIEYKQNILQCIKWYLVYFTTYPQVTSNELYPLSVKRDVYTFMCLLYCWPICGLSDTRNTNEHIDLCNSV